MQTCPKCHSNDSVDGACGGCGAPIQASSDPPVVDPLLGSLLGGRFRIESLIGSGGMGRVYRADQISLGKRVAVKVLHRKFFGDERVQRRFHREARAASLLDHPNCIRVIDFGRAEDNVLFIAMEYLEGRSLADLMTERGEISWDEIISILLAVSAALEEAHGRGVLHRDLKPDNIFLTHTSSGADVVKVLDFGIAKIVDEEVRDAPLTIAGTIGGTPEYMSPEHVQGKTVDARTDIYALGCILYQLLTGSAPFQGASPVEILTKQLNVPPQLPSERCPGRQIPVSLEWLSMRALSKDPDQRPPSAAAFSQELREARADLPPSAEQSEALFASVSPPVETRDLADTSEDPALEIGLAHTALALVHPDASSSPTDVNLEALDARARPWVIASLVGLGIAVVGFVIVQWTDHEDPKLVTADVMPSDTAADPIIAPPEDVVVMDVARPPDTAPKAPEVRVVRDAGSTKPIVAKQPSRKQRVASILERGRALMAQGESSNAIALFKQALASKDTDPEFNYELGRLYTRVSKPELARQHYKEYLRLKPNTTKRGLVESLLRAGK